MSSVDIYSILSTVEHNPHYLHRYVSFIQSRKEAVIGEEHHICPKARDMFPQFSSFKTHRWNKIKLTHREHFIAHMLLHKALGKSQSRAFWMMCNHNKITGKIYESARLIHKEMMLAHNPMNDPENRKKVARFGEQNSMWGKPGVNLGKTGEKNHLYGRKRPEHSKRMSGRGNPSFGKTPKKLICQCCLKEVDVRNYARWHGDKCRSRTDF